jgi:hypothetical protein
MQNLIGIIVKAIVMVAVVPGLIYVLFLLLNDSAAWFWATAVGVGNIMFITFSPQRSILQGVRRIGVVQLLMSAFMAAVLFKFLEEAPLINRVLHSICAFVSLVGCSSLGAVSKAKLAHRWRGKKG